MEMVDCIDLTGLVLGFVQLELRYVIGLIDKPAARTAKRERSGNSNCADSIQSISVLHDLTFNGGHRPGSPTPIEGNLRDGEDLIDD